MKTLAGAAFCAFVLAAAAPAFAGGYWDVRVDPPAPPPAYDGPPCERACPPPEPPCPCARQQSYRQDERWQEAPPAEADVVVPAEFFESESSVGPAFLYEGGGGGGGAVELGAFGESSASASASASAHVSVEVRVMEMQRRMMRQHQMMMQRHMTMSHGSYGGHW